METAVLTPGEITGNVLLYSTPEPLNPEAHGKLGVKILDKPFGFAATAHLVPLTVAEFQAAAISYPIIFVGAEYTPVAVMGLKEGDNLFITPDGAIDTQFYIPAYIRRYPFVFANDSTAERLVLCIDRRAELVDENGGDLPLFAGTEPSDYTKGAMEFCREFETERARTDSFVKLLKDLDLFEVKQALFTPRLANGEAGQPQVVAEYFGVSETKLAALPSKKVQELIANGALMQIHAHMISLLGWDRLVTRAGIKADAAAKA